MHESKKEDLFINKLLDETYASLPEEQSAKSSSDLANYFEDQVKQRNYNQSAVDLREDLSQKGIMVYELNYFKNPGFFRLKVDQVNFDFPENWSRFQLLKSYLMKGDLRVMSQDDSESLDELLSPLCCPYKATINYVVMGNQVLMVFLSPDDVWTPKNINWRLEQLQLLKEEDFKKVG